MIKFVEFLVVEEENSLSSPLIVLLLFLFCKSLEDLVPPKFCLYYS